ncbi:ABC transporter ATP-binding protein/permease [Candidatus Pacebacteria bacterium]|nr:ABC transporter ATP-binding protein/permease [Candidatus Paceibacterota bacterium]
MHFKSIFKHYWQFVVKYKWSQIIMLFVYGVGKIIDIALVPILFKEIIDTVSNPPTDPAPILYLLVGYLVVSHIFMNIVFRIGDYFIITSQSKILEELSNYSLTKLQNHSYSFFTNAFSGALIAKSKRFVAAFETLHDQFIFSLWFGGISLISSTAVLFYFSPILGGAFLLWLIIYILMVAYLVRYQIPKSLQNAAADTKVTAHFSDIIANFFTVKMFGASKREEKLFEKTVTYQEGKRRTAWMQESFWNGMFQGLNIDFFVIVFVTIAIWLWLGGSISAGTIVLIQIYAFTSFHVVWGISKNLIRVSAALTDANEMVEIFDQEVEVKDPEKPEKVTMPHGDVRFENVHFMYEKKTRMFAGLDLHIKSGEKVALVGHSGAGKTTITKLLLRFRDIDSGSITIDGQDIRHVLQDELRREIAYVPQEPLLFHRSIRENIAYAKPSATMKEIEAVAKKAHAHEFIQQLPNGYKTLVGERGVKLSGGERQRVAIARAMLKDAPIIMLDEATSSLDSLSESKIQDALWKLIKNKTTIIIAHRLSTIQKMDRIIVFNNGRVTEEGTHQTLIAKRGIYAELWDSQVGGFITE